MKYKIPFLIKLSSLVPNRDNETKYIENKYILDSWHQKGYFGTLLQPHGINNLMFLRICRSANLQASVTASQGFRSSVGGWIKLDNDQFCVC